MHKKERVHICVTKLELQHSKCTAIGCEKRVTHVIIRQTIGQYKILENYAVYTCDDHTDQAFETMNTEAENFGSRTP